MSKYSYEFKKQVVSAYLNGDGGYAYLAQKFGIPSFDKRRSSSTASEENSN